MTRVLLVLAALVAAFLAGANAYRRARIDARLAELDGLSPDPRGYIVGDRGDEEFVPAWYGGNWSPDFMRGFTGYQHPLNRNWRN